MAIIHRQTLSWLPLLAKKSIPFILIASVFSLHVYAESESSQSLPPVSIFSSFLSEELSQNCETQGCINDFISADAFYEAVVGQNKFIQAAASQDGFDYEILIANTLKTQADLNMLTEIDVTWRGIQLSSYQFSVAGISQELNDTEKQQLAVKTIGAFFSQAKQENVFSAEFLFNKLNASNYKRDLKLPASIDAFYLEDMQLYRDPFQGAVARYSHPEYSREVLDVFIYPSIHSAVEVKDSKEPLHVISQELSRDIDDIQLVAKARSIEEITISDIKRIDWQVDQRRFSGYYFDVEAEDNEGEPLFTTTYLFKDKDKFIKFSANFPDRIAQPMIRTALPQIEVPEPSDLMQSIRRTQG